MNNAADGYDALSWVDISRRIDPVYLAQIKRHSVVDSIASTNDWAMLQFKEGETPAVCFSEQQTQGRGRNGRDWVSPKTQNIYMSLAWSFALKPENLHALSLVVGVVIVQLLKQYGINAQLKWPNDVLVRGKKIAGVLLESRIGVKKNLNVVIGIGLNIEMNSALGKKIDRQWTDMSREIGSKKSICRNKIAGILLTRLLQACENYGRLGFGAYKDAWKSYDICRHAELEITTSDGVVRGKGLGISDNGALRVMLNGQEKIFYAADVSIRVKQ